METFKALDFEGLTFLNYRFDISSFSFCFEFTDFTGAKDSPKGRKYCLFVAWEQVLDASAKANIQHAATKVTNMDYFIP